jgi:mannose/cellobiose epimerase-like protein (N-acyl-D-glucosamine 2-epimerase family)
VASQLAVAHSPAAAEPDVPLVLSGDTWLHHHSDDLMPYWLVPDAFGDPLGNFPTFRDTDGHVTAETSPNRSASTLGRGAYGYSLAFLLTGDERFLTYARAGLDWIEAKLEDPVHGGYFAALDVNGQPLEPLANKDLFDLASVGLGYAMYFNVTRDPAAEAKLLQIRDLIFGPYYDAAANRLKDTLTYDLRTEVDTRNNGGDITNYLVPGTAMLLPTIGLLSDPARNEQFRTDLRHVTQALIDRHKNSRAVNPAERWMFWGRTARFGNFSALQTDFGHNIKSYAMIHNANQLFVDRPWSGLAADRTRMLDRAWDDAVGRWNQGPRSFVVGNVEPDSSWWIHDEADQLLAAIDLTDGVTNTERLVRSTQFFLDKYVDHVSPAHETWSRISRNPADTSLTKSATGKNMLHNMEHALILYLHGRMLEGRPARLYYALPRGQALTAETRPYWFDATGQERADRGPLDALPGHELVTVDFTGIGQAPRPPYPPPADTTAPITHATLDPPPTHAGWNRSAVTVTLTAQDDLVGVKELRGQIEPADSGLRGTAFVRPGGDTSLTLSEEGRYRVTYRAIDLLGNTEPEHTVQVNIDRTDPTLDGLPDADCRLWPPNHRFVPITAVTASDAFSGLDHIDLEASSSDDDPAAVRVVDGQVWVRAELATRGQDRTYTVTAFAVDRAGNTTSATGNCLVSPPGRHP